MTPQTYPLRDCGGRPWTLTIATETIKVKVRGTELECLAVTATADQLGSVYVVHLRSQLWNEYRTPFPYGTDQRWLIARAGVVIADDAHLDAALAIGARRLR